MRDNKWSEAAARYQSKNDRLAQQATEQKREEEAKKERERVEAMKKAGEIFQGMEQLEAFLDDHGSNAMTLLKTSGRHIIFGESRDGGGFAVIYMMSGCGLQQCVESTSMSAAFGNGRNPKPVPTRITVQQAIEAAVNYGGKKATEVVDWLKAQLDMIADAAPE